MAAQDYTVGQKIVHWLMGFLITMDLFIAQKFGGQMADWDRLESRIDHSSLGTIVAVLFVIRLILRYRHGAPSLPTQMPDWQVRTARIGHGLLYGLMGFLILSGMLTAMNAASPIPLFGLFDITLGRVDESRFAFVRQFHEFATIAVIGLIAIHVVAAVYHHFVVRDRLTFKMLNFWRTMP